jgi:flotillin
MTMNELFAERQMFRDKVIRNVQSEVDQFGLRIYNANVKELQDCANMNYFEQLSKKAHEGAINQAKVCASLMITRPTPCLGDCLQT